MDEEIREFEELIEKIVQNYKKKIKDVDDKLQNNDYDECSKINHDKMVLENRKMILEDRIELLELRKTNVKMDSQYYDYANNNNLILNEIIEIISKDNGISHDTKEKISNLLHKIKPKKLTLNTGLVKAER